MPLYQVILLAIVQGFTEFLPISSTAHLYLTSWLLGWEAQALEFDIALHAGTLAAVLVYFYKDLVQIVTQGLGMKGGSDSTLRQNRALMWLIGLGTIPVGVAGLAFGDYAETAWRSPILMAVMLIGVGVVMWVADRRAGKGRSLAGVNAADAVSIGLAQALAIVPGTSRSGITITAGLFRGMDRETAARFSFLLSTPAIAAAAAKAFYDLVKQGGIAPDMRVAFAVGVVVSGLTGWAVIAWFLRYLRHRSLAFFVYYRIVFGIIVLALAFYRWPAG